MSLKEKVTREELILYEIFKNPVLCGEFINNIDKLPHEEPFEFSYYQKDMLCDFSSYVSICTARATGKTVVLSNLLVWVLINNIFPEDYIVYHVPGKAHVEPVFTSLIRMFRTNSVLKHFLPKRSGINRSDLIIKTLNNATLMCRIAGQTGTGVSVIGLHTPFECVDECIVGTQRVAGKNTNKRISEFKIGDIVLSWDGENIVEDRVSSVKKIKRDQKVLEIQFKDSYIRVGENHRIYTDDGYKEAKYLSKNDTIYFFSNTKRKSFTENEIEYIKNQIQKSIPVKEIAKKLNRTNQSIFRKIQNLNLSVRGIYDDIPLSKEEYQIILGSFLGDGSACIYDKRASYNTNHSLKQKEYVDWIRKKLNRLVRAEPRIYKNGGWGKWNYHLSTLGHPQILDMAKELYISNKKTITRNYLNKLDPLGLAVWWMDDGCESGLLSTHSFSKEENEIIVKYLKETWNIDSKICIDKSKNLYFIRIRNLTKFRELIKPHIPKCMRYKIGDGFYNNDYPKIELIPKGEDNSTLQKCTIKNIREVKTRSKYLYNIEVENNHNFFVNGILTKNSGYYPQGTFTELQPTLNTFTSGHRLLVSGVPTGIRENNVLFHTDQENSSYSKHRVSAFDNPRFSKEDYEKAIEIYGGEDSDDFIHLVCFHPETLIYTNNGLKNIKNISVGDIVLTHKGNWKPVTRVYKRKYSGKLLSIKTQKNYKKILCTPNHPIYAKNLKKVTWSGNKLYSLWKGNYRNGGKKKGKPISLYPEFIPANNLECLDRVAFPKFFYQKKLPKEIDFTKYGIVKNDYVYYKSNARNNHFRLTSKFPQKIKLDSNILKFLGLYIAEGSCSRESQIQLVFNKKEIHLCTLCINVIENYFGISAHLTSGAGNSKVLVFSSKIFYKFISEYIGRGAENKRIPNFLLGVNSKSLIPLLEGLFAGDGYCRVKNNAFLASYSTVSLELINNIEFILRGLGIYPTKYFIDNSRKKRKILSNKNYTYPKDVYNLEINHKDISNIYNNNVNIWNTFDNGDFAIPITNIDKEDYTGYVYNLEVEKDNSYVTENFSVHNCGQHGRPLFTLFDRNNMAMENYPVYKLEMDGTKFFNDLGKYYEKLSVFPGLPNKKDPCIFGIDLGFTEPTALVILYINNNGRIKFHGRIRLDKVNYHIQEKIIDWLDTKFQPSIIAIDEGNTGKSVIPRLRESEEFAHKDYHKRVLPVNFSSSIVLGIDSEGKEIKSKTKPFTVGVLQDYTNNHKIIYTSTDLELITELERMTYTKNINGDIVYRTLTERGGKKGEDHFTAALLCAAMGYYLENESLYFKPKKQKLAQARWHIGGNYDQLFTE